MCPSSPWHIDIDIEDALADLHAAGLVNRLNKRVVWASRAAIRADELNS
jgi:hypothetical protein